MTENYLYWGLALYGASLLLVVVELFVPSGGVVGLLAGTVAIAGDVCLWMHSTTWGLLGILLILVAGPLLFYFGVNLLPSTPIGRKLLFGESGKDVTPRIDEQPNELAHLVGMEGQTLTDLRPVGAARIDGKRYEVLSETYLIPVGTKVRVISVQGNQIKVRAVK